MLNIAATTPNVCMHTFSEKKKVKYQHMFSFSVFMFFLKNDWLESILEHCAHTIVTEIKATSAMK